MTEQKERIQELESLLDNERLQLHSNKMASEILRRFIDDGDAVQLENGEVHLTKPGSGVTNTIQNAEDMPEEYGGHM